MTNDDSNNGDEAGVDANSLFRSLHISAIIGCRSDQRNIKTIEESTAELKFHPIRELMISQKAWDHVRALTGLPGLVFAHPDLIREHPEISQHYRGIALLSRKQVQQATKVQVVKWEDESSTARVTEVRARTVACLYNTVISSIIEASTNWTLENGYRNILATMGITLDGVFRNKIGAMAEAVVKNRILDWLREKQLISLEESSDGNYVLPQETVMSFGSEPDIKFVRNGELKATIEIKGGTDPAGALERLGAMDKSFKETPIGCDNFLIAGVITEEMGKRLSTMRVKTFKLDKISTDGAQWDKFVDELFHYSLRIYNV